MAKISDLSTLSSLEMNDLLLVSRLVGTITNQDKNQYKYIAFNMDAASLTTQLCGAVYAKLESDYVQPFYENATSALNKISNEYDVHVSTLNEHLSDCNKTLNDLNTLQCNLCVLWDNLSTNLCAEFEDLCSKLSNWLSSKFKDLSDNLCNSIKSSIETMNNTHNALSSSILNYVSTHYVSLTGDQSISGTKTFANPIHGMALSSKWN